MWIACVAAVLGVAIWVGFFAYKHVAYQDDLWWRFALHGNASRFLRASLAASLFLAGLALWRLFAPARVEAVVEASDPAAIRPALGCARHTDAMLALTGDKRFLISEAGDAFLMYQIKGASWIVMADPVGAREACADLLWTIREMADAAQGRLLLYEISDETLGCAIELGLHVVKCGEEALVDLAGFSLEGSAMRALRQGASRARRDGLAFEVVPAADVAALIPTLALISDQWLAAKGQTEKGFSLGRFDPAYLAQFDCAVIRKAGQVVAFANLWATADKSELSIDLMRHGDAAPPGTMDFLFLSLMLWGKAQHYERFSLGLAPLSGIEGKPLAPTWAKIARLLFEHGERFYGFKGLRAYKDKFDPRWESRYIAGPRGLAMIQGLLDLNALIGR
jgi:phosphatidylglycerol lysyltransferase